MNLEDLYKHDLGAAGKAAQRWAKRAGWPEPDEGEHLQDYLHRLMVQHDHERRAHSGAVSDRAHMDGWEPPAWNRTEAPAQLLIDRCGEMTEDGRKAIAKWLREQAKLVESSGHNFDDTFRARYLRR